MKQRLPILFFILFSLSLAYSKQGETGKEYFPQLKEMEYSVSFVTPSGEVINETMIVRDSGKEVINGKSYIKRTFQLLIPGLPPKYSYIRITPEGIYETYEKDGPEYLSYPFPLKVGLAWERNRKSGTDKCKVEGIENVDLGHIQYKNCLKISVLESDKPQIYEYLAKGVGVVKYQVQEKGMAMTLALKRYSR